MKLPPTFVDELRSRVSIAEIVGRTVAWDPKKTNRGKGDYWAACPFHVEKSASFHVDDRKGFYYCFGCQAKGDVLSFLRDAGGMGFMDAVTLLAREAGMELPQLGDDPGARARADRRGTLHAALEAAVRHYRMQLSTAAGAAARAYLETRGLGTEAIERFEIGYAPPRGGIGAALTGHDADLLVAAGLVARPDDGSPYDRFRDRIVFPIRDARGRPVGFGGRAMDPASPAKYLNSPASEVFDKGRTLYNLRAATEAVRKGAPLVVAEGYMDVIALVGAGFGGAVAPLGTAITEAQLGLMWTASPEPVVLLDGDRAGQAAALRLADLALPLIRAGQSLRFATLPDGLDPDDLARQGGAPAIQAVVEAAEPMVALLWRRETDGRAFDSPERRAALDASLRALLARIADAPLRAHYAEAMRERRRAMFAPARPQWKSRAAAAPRRTTRSSLLVAAQDAAVEDRLREAVILATLVVHPGLVERFRAELEGTAFEGPDHAAIAASVLRHGPDGARAKVAADAGDALEKLFASGHVTVAPPVRNTTDETLAMHCLAEEFARLAARRGVARETREAAEDLAGYADEGVTWRLSQAAETLHRAGRTGTDEAADLGEDRPALSRRLQDLIDSEVWVKKLR